MRAVIKVSGKRMWLRNDCRSWNNVEAVKSSYRRLSSCSMCRFVVLVRMMGFAEDFAFYCLVSASVSQTPVLPGLAVVMQKSLR